MSRVLGRTDDMLIIRGVNLFSSQVAVFGDPVLAMPSVAIVTIWWTVGFNMLLFIAGLQNIPIDLYEAAGLDGANWLQKFLFITCPLIWPVASLVLVLHGFAHFASSQSAR